MHIYTWHHIIREQTAHAKRRKARILTGDKRLLKLTTIRVKSRKIFASFTEWDDIGMRGVPG